MSSALTTPYSPPREATVARKKSEGGLRQVNIRLDHAYYAEIEEAAAMLGLDVAQFLRMIIRENFPEYRKRAAEVKRQQEGQAD